MELDKILDSIKKIKTPEGVYLIAADAAKSVWEGSNPKTSSYTRLLSDRFNVYSDLRERLGAVKLDYNGRDRWCIPQDKLELLSQLPPSTPEKEITINSDIYKHISYAVKETGIKRTTLVQRIIAKTLDSRKIKIGMKNFYYINVAEIERIKEDNGSPSQKYKSFRPEEEIEYGKDRYIILRKFAELVGKKKQALKSRLEYYPELTIGHIRGIIINYGLCKYWYVHAGEVERIRAQGDLRKQRKQEQKRIANIQLIRDRAKLVMTGRKLKVPQLSQSL